MENRIGSAFLFLSLYLSWFAPVLVRGEGYPLSKLDFVVTLDDNTFEHETQASTGQTTGSWLIWFHKRKDDTPIVGTPPDDEFWAEHHTILGAVDVSRSELTKSRFNVRKLPSLLFIHKGRVYRYPKEENYPFSWDTITRFVIEEYANVDAEEVPPPRTFFDEVMEYVDKVMTEGEMFFRLLGYVFGVLVTAAIVNQVFFVDRSKDKKEKKAKKKE